MILRTFPNKFYYCFWIKSGSFFHLTHCFYNFIKYWQNHSGSSSNWTYKWWVLQEGASIFDVRPRGKIERVGLCRENEAMLCQKNKLMSGKEISNIAKRTVIHMGSSGTRVMGWRGIASIEDRGIVDV